MIKNDLDQFEAALIRDGGQSTVAMRRKGPAILARLTPPARQAVETYSATAEAVLAGGAMNPSDPTASRSQGGAPSREGRQSGFVDQVSFLRRMEAAVARRVKVGRQDPTTIDALDLWRAVCLGDATMEGFLKRHGLAPAKSRMADLNAAFLAAGDRVADAIGRGRDPSR
jgi:hypothetical protein